MALPAKKGKFIYETCSRVYKAISVNYILSARDLKQSSWLLYIQRLPSSGLINLQFANVVGQQLPSALISTAMRGLHESVHILARCFSA